jgi:cyclopropane-fatty-acyl-phospholipid synthase
MTGTPARPESTSAAARRATDVLRHVFGRLSSDLAFRLWDGTVVTIGAGAPAFTVVLHTAETFFRLMRDPTPYAFAEAYVESAIDIEGDLFAAMSVAEALESLRLPLAERVRIAWLVRAPLKSAHQA